MVAVYASGELEPAEVYRSFATVSGIVQEVFVQEGDTVPVDAPLLRLKSENIDYNVQNARLALQMAQFNAAGDSPVLQELQVQIDLAKQQLSSDSANYERLKRVSAGGGSYPAELERYELAYNASKKNVEMAKKRQESTRVRLKNDADRAATMFSGSQSSSRDFVVYSFLPGVVYGIYKKPGELVMMQEPVALIGSGENFIAKLTIDELDISKVRIGQVVHLMVDTYGKKTWLGKVTKIYPQPDLRTQAFRVDVEFVDEMPKLYPGLSVEANIVIEEKTDVLVIPMQYLKEGRMVKLKSGEWREVETGETDNRFIEIVSGITEDDELILPLGE